MSVVDLPAGLLSSAFTHLFLSIHSSVPSPARHLPSTVQRTTLQSITITSRKESVKETEQRNWSEPAPATTTTTSISSPSTPTLSPTVSCAPSPPGQPSLLATLLARKKSIVTVPATKEVSPPLRGSSRSSPDRLPYLPHSPFHLFSYDLDEEPSPPALGKPSEESPKPTTPRSDGQQSTVTNEFKSFPSLQMSCFLLSQFPLLILAFCVCVCVGTSSEPLCISFVIHHFPSFQFFHLTASHLEFLDSYCHFSFLHVFS